MNEQVMPKVSGKRFRCSCGCNVFTKYETGRYRCNSCRTCYESEEATPRSEELPITDIDLVKQVVEQYGLPHNIAAFHRIRKLVEGKKPPINTARDAIFLDHIEAMVDSPNTNNITKISCIHTMIERWRSGKQHP